MAEASEPVWYSQIPPSDGLREKDFVSIVGEKLINKIRFEGEYKNLLQIHVDKHGRRWYKRRSQNPEWIDISGDGGIMKKILVEGNGPKPINEQEVKVHYVGTLQSTGEKFDSSRDRPGYFNFELGKGRVIKGWDQGVATMNCGEKCILRCRSDYAYGENGSPPKIPGGATLDFEVELFANFKPVDEVEDIEYMMIGGGTQWTKAKEEANVTFDFAICEEFGNTIGLEKEDCTLEVLNSDQFSEFPEWFHMCLQMLGQGQTAVFSLSGASVAVPDSWGASQGYFKVLLKQLENPKETWQMSPEEQVEEVKRRKDKGNGFFRAGQYKQAKKQYEKAYDAIETVASTNKLELTGEEADDSELPDLSKAGEEFPSLYISVNSNLAMTSIKLKEYSSGIEAASRALKFEPNHLKSLCRRAQCYAQSEKYDEALQDCDAVLKLDPKNASTLQVQAFVNRKIQLEEKRIQRMASKMFGGGKKKKKKKPSKPKAVSKVEDSESKEEEAETAI